MPNWRETHDIRINAAKRVALEAVEMVNRELLAMPPRFKLTVNADGRELALVEDDSDPAPAEASAEPKPD